jgi:hypothetical protein
VHRGSFQAGYPWPIVDWMTPTPDKSSEKTDAFIARWQGQEGGQERANYALFLTELCDVLDLPHPDVAKATHAHNDYVFERAVQRHLTDGDAAGRIDLYKRNSFVLEAKQSRWKGGGKEIAGQNDLFNADDEQQDRGRRGASRAWDVLMLNAKRQAEEYARGLPPSIGRAGDIRRFPHLDRTGVAVHRVRLHKYRCDNVVAGTGAPADNAACPRLRDVCLTNCDNLSLQKDDGFRQIAIHSFIDWPSCTEGFCARTTAHIANTDNERGSTVLRPVFLGCPLHRARCVGEGSVPSTCDHDCASQRFRDELRFFSLSAMVPLEVASRF